MRCRCVLLISTAWIVFQWANSTTIHKCAVPQTRPTNESYTRICLPKSDVNRTFAYSKNAPLATELNAQPWGAYGLLQILAHFESEGSRVRSLARRKRQLFVQYIHEACNMHVDEADHERVNRFLSELGIGLLRTRCVTELATERVHTPVAAVRTFLKELRTAGMAAMDGKKMFTYQLYQYSDSTDNCELMRVTAVRTGGNWAIHAGVTSAPARVYREDGSRAQIVELLRLNAVGDLEVVPLVLRNVSTGLWENATTLREVRGSVHGTSLFDETKVVADNPAVLAAIAQRAHQRQQVISYTSPSIMAVIMVPVLSSLVPISYFTDLSSPMLLMYTILKDIVNAIPLIIKGTELILFGKGMVPQATRTWIYGGERDDDIAVAETWFAACRANVHVVWKGQVFILTGLIVTLFGISLELFVMKVVELRKRRKAFVNVQERMIEGRQMWTGALCNDCQCGEREIESVIPNELDVVINVRSAESR